MNIIADFLRKPEIVQGVRVLAKFFKHRSDIVQRYGMPSESLTMLNNR